ncbi:MAG TPA: winged helix-turn-helix domain-containing protein [Ilumatobacteraceae bacterium]|nr:winged helix-turn-helix domain-containing protein [Ilumatobacteraceae bacterium]
MGAAASPAAALAALADPTRQQILELLSEHGPQSASALATRLPITRQAIAKQLRILTEAGLVQADRDGREVLFDLVAGGAADAASWLAATADRWQQRIDRLHRLVDG